VENVASINGAIFAVGNLVSAIGPGVGAAIFAWSNSNGLFFPFNYYLIWLLLSGCALINLFIRLMISAKDKLGTPPDIKFLSKLVYEKNNLLKE